MARFVSRYGNYSHGVREEVAEHFARGTRVIVTGLEAQFGRGGLTEDDVKYALEKFQFHGLPEDTETGGNISGQSRLSVFDSDAYAKAKKLSVEDHALVVETLRESGLLNIDFVEVIPEAAAIPWNGYDGLSDPDEIAELTEKTGTPVDLVLAYEIENKNRKSVIEALESIEKPVVDEPVVIDASGS